MIKKNGVSFIVTVFNKELFIEKTLQSIKKNLFGNNQIIIIDDGSTDNSVDKIRNFIKRNHKIDIKLLLQKNSGPSIATNNCLMHVIYSHIKMVDGDDILALSFEFKICLINPSSVKDIISGIKGIPNFALTLGIKSLI